MPEPENLLPAEQVSAEVATTTEPMLPTAPRTPMEILDRMSIEGVDPAALQVVADLAWKQQDRDAVTAFNVAFVRFHELLPTLVNETQGVIKKQGVVIISWMYDKMPVLARKVRPVLQLCGFVVSFDSKHEGGMIEGEATLRHVRGHSTSARAFCPVGSSNGMSPQHAITAAESNAKRRALIDVLGITPVDEPDENSTEDVGPITEAQAADLEAMIEEVGASLGRFLSYYGIESVAVLPSNQFAGAVQMLREKTSR